MNKTGKGNDVHNNEGIKKISNTEVQVVTRIRSNIDLSNWWHNSSPLHYYGDEALYDYENNMFGFTRRFVQDKKRQASLLVRDPINL